MENIESTKESKMPSNEEEARKDVREILKLSSFFETMTPDEQEQLINEMYEKYYKDKEKEK